MAIVAADILFKLSGGGANSDPNAALGGVISSVNLTDNTLHNLFDVVSGAEAAAGDTEYRCLYIKNNHGSLTWQGVGVYIDTNTPSSDTTVTIGLGTSAISATEQTVANENTAPSGVTFFAAAGSGAALSIGDVAAGATKALWIKRIVTAGAAAYNNDSVVIGALGDTAA